MIRTGFNLIAAGVLLVLVDFYIRGIEIVPDFLGYGLILLGAGHTRHLDKMFSQLIPLSAPMIVVSLADYLVGAAWEESGLVQALSTISLLAQFTVLWMLATGVREAAGRAMIPELKDRAESVRWTVLYFAAALIILNLLSNLLESFATAGWIIGFLAELVLAALFVMLMRSAGDLLGEPPTDPLALHVPDGAAT